MSKNIITAVFILLTIPGYSCSQQHKQKSSDQTTTTVMTLRTEQLNNPVVKQAIEALQKGDEQLWLSLFATEVLMLDDGNKIDFLNFSKNAMGHERFTSIDKVEDNGLSIFGKFHSDQWGDFKTYFKFQINKQGKIDKLEIGQAKY